MAYQAVFERYELKFLVTEEQKKKIISAISPYMQMDSYGHTFIQNIYYDTDNFRLIRRSIEKPVFKEKLRVRAYGKPCENGTVFVEIKRKYKSVVHKRRITLTENEASHWLSGKGNIPDSQIAREIDYFKSYYGGIKPKVYLSYEREAFYLKDGGDFRLTFDNNILFRTDSLCFSHKPCGQRVIKEGLSVMEIKCSGGIPLWLTDVLSKEHIYKRPFSKYGTVYTNFLKEKL